MVLQHNLLSMNTNRQLNINTKNKQKTSERLSSGYRINRAADDAASLTISEKMRSMIRGLGSDSRNLSDGISYVQVADGALGEVQAMLHRVTELSIQSANDTNTEADRAALNNEIGEIKNEITKIFNETSFNTRRIWEADPSTRVQVGTEPVRAVSAGSTSGNNFDVTNSNVDYYPAESIRISADVDGGITLSWHGSDNNLYTSSPIDFDALEASDYAFNLKNYFTGSDGGTINKTFRITPNEYATREDIANAINGTYISVSNGINTYARLENASGSSSPVSGISFSSSINFGAAYAAGVDYDNADDSFIEIYNNSPNLTRIPGNNTSDVSVAQNTHEAWQFKFDMGAIGPVTADVSSITYYSNDRSSYSEDKWWYHYTSGGRQYTSGKLYTASENTLAGVMDVINKDTNSHSLRDPINPADPSSRQVGGTISVHFELKSDSPYTYLGRSSTSVGSMNMSISVGANDTEQDILDRINSALNPSTRLDAYTSSGTGDRTTIYYISPRADQINAPIFEGHYCSLQIQAGPLANQSIDIAYDAMSLKYLGIQNIDISTYDGAQDAIGKASEALAKVSDQRSLFGAYQNRMEYSLNYTRNTAENTQAAESLLRDTDMASEMVEHSKHNILEQAATSMLAQANSSSEGVLSLLQ